MRDKDIPAYVGIMDCGCVVMAVVDDGNPKRLKNVAQDVYECIMDGVPVHRKTVGWVNENGLATCAYHKALEEKECGEQETQQMEMGL